MLVIWVLFINLLSATGILFIHYKFKKLGILLIHYGILFYCFSAFVNFYGSTESNVSLIEKATTNVSVAYRKWELSFWVPEESFQRGEIKREVYAVNDTAFDKKDIEIRPYHFSMIIDQYYVNAEAYLSTEDSEAINYYNDSGLRG